MPQTHTPRESFSVSRRVTNQGFITVCLWISSGLMLPLGVDNCITNNKQNKQNKNKNKGKTEFRQVTNKTKKTTTPYSKAPVAANKSSGRNQQVRHRVRECERIATISGSVLFDVVTTVPLQPGLTSSFPWLAGVANHYDRYKVHSITYTYKNVVGTSTNGNIIMGFDYDARDAAPTTAIQQTQSTSWIDGAPWRIFSLTLRPDNTYRYVRTQDVSFADVKTYDMGNLFISCEGMAATTPVGYLEVMYDIEFFDKSSTSHTEGGTPYLTNTTTAFATVADNLLAVTNTDMLWNGVNLNQIGITKGAADEFVFAQEGYYKIEISVPMTVSVGAVSRTLSLRTNGVTIATTTDYADTTFSEVVVLQHIGVIGAGEIVDVRVTMGGGATWTTSTGSGNILITRL